MNVVRVRVQLVLVLLSLVVAGGCDFRRTTAMDYIGWGWHLNNSKVEITQEICDDLDDRAARDRFMEEHPDFVDGFFRPRLD